MAEPMPRPLRPDAEGWSPPDWRGITARLEDARHYWIATASTEALPHSTPVEGIWMRRALWIGDISGTRRTANLGANGSVIAHLADTSSVVILRGKATRNDDIEDKRALAAANTAKYGIAFPPETARWFEIRPTEVLTWEESELDVTGTRWIW